MTDTPKDPPRAEPDIAPLKNQPTRAWFHGQPCTVLGWHEDGRATILVDGYAASDTVRGELLQFKSSERGAGDAPPTPPGDVCVCGDEISDHDPMDGQCMFPACDCDKFRLASPPSLVGETRTPTLRELWGSAPGATRGEDSTSALVGETRAEPDNPERFSMEGLAHHLEFAQQWPAAANALRAMRSRLSTVEAERDEARKDSERIDWLEARTMQDEHVELNYTDAWRESGDYGSILSEGPAQFWLRDNGGECGPTLRGAIDDARRSYEPDSSPSSETTATPSDDWNQRRLNACRITGSTYERQNDEISGAARAYVESLDHKSLAPNATNSHTAR